LQLSAAYFMAPSGQLMAYPETDPPPTVVVARHP